MRRLLLALLLVLLAAPSWGQASRDFDGSNDSLACGDIDGLEGVPQLTVGCWVVLDDNDGVAPGIIVKGADSAPNLSWALIKGAGEDLQFRIHDGTTTQLAVSGASTIPFGTFGLAVGVYDRATTPRVRVYWNGALVGQDNSTNDADITSTTHVVEVGKISSVEWDGSIAHCFAEARAWSVVEIAEAYRGSLVQAQRAAGGTGGYLPLWDNGATPAAYIGQGLLSGVCTATNHPAVSSNGPPVMIAGGGQ